MPPFTREEFLAIFATYNEAIWPMQILAAVLGGIAAIGIFWRAPLSDLIDLDWLHVSHSLILGHQYPSLWFWCNVCSSRHSIDFIG
jgi:hypothetical protein